MCAGSQIGDALKKRAAGGTAKLSSGAYEGGFVTKAMGGLPAGRARKRSAKLPEVPLLGLASLDGFGQS